MEKNDFVKENYKTNTFIEKNYVPAIETQELIKDPQDKNKFIKNSQQKYVLKNLVDNPNYYLKREDVDGKNGKYILKDVVNQHYTPNTRLVGDIKGNHRFIPEYYVEEVKEPKPVYMSINKVKRIIYQKIMLIEIIYL